jgi:hypothetical protein
MSTKTLRKRISLVAVTALTAGVLSVVAVPSANAANIAGSTNAVTTSGSLNVAVVASTTGAASAVASAAGAANTSTSLGLVFKDDTSTVAQTATMLSNGALALYAGATTATKMAVTASGGKFTSARAASTALADAAGGEVAGDQKSVYWADSVGAGTGVAVLWTPGAVGTYTVKLYRADGVNTAPSAVSPAGGTLTGQVIVTVVASSVAGAMSSTYTLCNIATSSTAATGTDSSAGLSVANGSTGFINFQIKDGYDTEITAGYPLVATATNGAIVNIGSTIGSAAGSTSVSVADNSSSIVVAQPTANAPVSTTVTLTYNGTTVCTKSLTIRGEVAKVTVTPAATQLVSGTTFTDRTYGVSGGNFRVQTFDSAGNLTIPTNNTAVFTAVASTLDGTSVTNLTIGTVATAIATTDATGLWPSVNSLGIVTCSSSAGTDSDLKMNYINPSGTVVTSNSFTARCANNPYTYTASWDKAAYKQGEIATLTVQFKDIKGNNAATVSTGTAATISAPQMTRVGGDPTASKQTTIDGQIVHTFTVGTTTAVVDGSYVALVNYPDYTAVAATIQQVPYSVSTGTNAVSNADVLKSIVALIASINKQIQALQKLILKR